MYLYQVDKAVTYTSEDLVLFRESPFASWMERLTLENPDHGILPDTGSTPPQNSMARQDDMAETLRAEGKDVLLVDWEAEEPARRIATLAAMRQGVDFIVNGQLALGPLSGSANLLMRTSGYSELGDYLYIPCDTQAKTTLHSAFRLCFLADLLHSLQGQLPPQMLIIRGGDLVPLRTEDHVYHYQAVKHRFMEAMREFRKHRMPDPSESTEFGRWSDCAHEVIKQRALGKDQEWPEEKEQAEEPQELPVQQAAAAGDTPVQASPVENLDATHRTLTPGATPGAAVVSPGGQVPRGPTLAEQARMLAPASAGAGESRADAGPGNFSPAADTGASYTPGSTFGTSLDDALDNLEFIGSRHRSPGSDRQPSQPVEPPRVEYSAELAAEEENQAADPIEFDEQDVAFLPLEINDLDPANREKPEADLSDPAKDFTETASVTEAPLSSRLVDFDLPEFGEPLPLPEVEEISLDGMLLPEGWPQPESDPEPEPEQKTSRSPDHLFSSGAPPPALKSSSAWERPNPGQFSAGEPVTPPKSHPLDSDVAVESRYPTVDPDLAPLSQAPAAIDSNDPSEALEGEGKEEKLQPVPQRPPREDSDEPNITSPFSSSLITSEQYED